MEKLCWPARWAAALRPLAMAGAVLLAVGSQAQAQQVLVNGGFENNPPSTMGNHIPYSIAPWILTGTGQANVVKVNGGGYNYPNGPNVDATGSGTRNYLDLANAGNSIYQTFPPQCSGQVKFSGFFSSRINMG